MNEWIAGIIGASLVFLGNVIVAFIRSKSDSDSTTVHARNALQDQTLNYAKQLEQQIKDVDERFNARMEAERAHCELQLESQSLRYEKRIKELEDKIAELQETIKLRRSPRPISNTVYNWPDSDSASS